MRPAAHIRNRRHLRTLKDAERRVWLIAGSVLIVPAALLYWHFLKALWNRL